MTDAEAITILVVEDHQITRRGLILTLQLFDNLQVVGEACDGSSAVSKCLELHPAVVITDIGLPIMSGIEATKEIKRKLPQTRVIALTSHEEDDAVFSALAAGADGYCLKNISGEQLYMAIMSVHAGACWLDPGIAQRVLQASISSPKNSDPSKFALSPRELEILALIVEGLANQEIAKRLIISHDTVKTHMRHIMEKLMVADRTQAAVKALKQGLV